jgi:acetyl esterase/lipase
MKNVSRRGFIKLTATTVVLYPFGHQLFARQKEVSVKTYTYKKVGELEIKVVVHRRDDNIIRPVVVRIHGGALINGHRDWDNDKLCLKLLEEDYAIVSVDYRLAPETKLPDIIEDIEDVFDWIHEKGPELFQIDVSKIAVTGNSAGGYLTLTSGFRVKPRPTVLVAFYGYGDLIGDWYSTPSKHPRHKSDITEQEAWGQSVVYQSQIPVIERVTVASFIGIAVSMDFGRKLSLAGIRILKRKSFSHICL